MANNNIILLDGSERFHVQSALDALGDIQEIRGDLNIKPFIDPDFVESLIIPAHNPSRNQVDIFRLGEILMSNDFLHRKNRDATKVIITDRDLYDSRENINFGFGVNLPFDENNRYVIVSGSRMKNELHLQHVLRHELGHAFGAPNPRRPGVYNSLGSHCPDRNCTMHQELSGESSYQQALRIHNLGKYFCNACKNDIGRKQ